MLIDNNEPTVPAVGETVKGKIWIYAWELSLCLVPPMQKIKLTHPLVTLSKSFE